MASRKRININIHSDTLLEMDWYRSQMGLSRSMLIETLIKKWLEEEHDIEEKYRILPTIGNMTDNEKSIRAYVTMEIPF